MQLKTFFSRNPSVALAFSGGVDSTYLMYVARESGTDVRAYFVKTAFQPEFEYRDAMRAASLLDTPVTVLECDILSCEGVTQNPENRCYICKKALFSKIIEHAAQDGMTVVIDGTNASDEFSDRPGMRALAELSVRSPLRECGLTKDEVRRLSKEAGLFTWDKPAYACLATRVPAGTTITAELLASIEYAEDALFKMGFEDFRVRVYGGAARIQVAERQMRQVIERRERILCELSKYFDVITLDLKER